MNRFQELIDKVVKGRVEVMDEKYFSLYVGEGVYLWRKSTFTKYSIGRYCRESDEFLVLTYKEVYTAFTGGLVGTGWASIDFRSQWMKLYESIEVEKSLQEVFL